jgi:hypothetical protein
MQLTGKKLWAMMSILDRDINYPLASIDGQWFGVATSDETPFDSGVAGSPVRRTGPMVRSMGFMAKEKVAP